MSCILITWNNSSSILEIGLSILAASLTALRPLLKTIPSFADANRNGPPDPSGFGSLDTFGNIHYDQRPIYRLEDRNVSDAESQENIIPAQPCGVKSQGNTNTTCSPVETKRQRVRDGEAW